MMHYFIVKKINKKKKTVTSRILVENDMRIQTEYRCISIGYLRDVYVIIAKPITLSLINRSKCSDHGRQVFQFISHSKFFTYRAYLYKSFSHIFFSHLL